MDSGKNWLGVMHGALLYMAQRPGVEVFGELWNVVLDEDGEDKMVRESN